MLPIPVDGELRPGDVLAGKYRIERVLGVGGMGVVVAAHHLQLDERVALKFLLPEAARNDASVARFLQEARAAVKVKSEHVARVIDVGQLESGSPYMVMELLEGGDLATWLLERGPMPVQLAVDFVLQTCEALADAHSLGIVHRDLKPANLFCIQRSDGELSIKVLDFGISKVTTPGAPGHDMTRTSTLMGSPFYMSPEQMKHTKGVDARTDIWSLGVILFELVAGRRPFEAETVTELAIKVASDPAPPLRALRPDAHPALEQVVARCLEKDRAHRFSDVGELAVALKALGSTKARVSVERVLGVLRRSGISSAVLPPSGTFAMHAVSAKVADTVSARSLPGGLPETTAEWTNTGEPARPRGRGARAARWIVGALAVGALAIAGALLLKERGAPAAPPNVVAVAASSPPAVEPPTAPPPPASTSGVAAVAPAVVAASPSVARSPPAPPASVARTPSTHPAARSVPPPSAQPVPAGAAKPNCNPPYVIDSATGDRKYKLECL